MNFSVMSVELIMIKNSIEFALTLQETSDAFRQSKIFLISVKQIIIEKAIEFSFQFCCDRRFFPIIKLECLQYKRKLKMKFLIVYHIQEFCLRILSMKSYKKLKLCLLISIMLLWTTFLIVIISDLRSSSLKEEIS